MTKRKEDVIDPNNNIQNNYINTSTTEQLKALQRSIALLRQDLHKIINEELVKFLNHKQHSW